VSDQSVVAEVRERVAAVRRRIREAAESAGREPGAITLVGVSKRQPPERIAAAIRAGVLELGENYVQEARDKQLHLEELLAGYRGPRPRWRMIGRLQRNKARTAVKLFGAVDSLDRTDLADELDRRAATLERQLDLCLQVDLSGEPQKGGVSPEGLEPLLAHCSGLRQLRVVGLMTMPAPHPDPEASRPAFAQLRELRDTLRGAPGAEQLRELSMGMSADFAVAIQEGATLVRVGTALFGARKN
jgi:pyridoxal phosphate enzyme (YggS family)